MVSPRQSAEGWRGFFIVVIFFQTDTSSLLVILKTLAISAISVLASFMHYEIIVRVVPDSHENYRHECVDR